MNKLIEYIFESQSLIYSGVTPELFKKFFNKWIHLDSPYDMNNADAMDAYEELAAVLRPKTRNYPKIIKAIYNYCNDFVNKLYECGINTVDDDTINKLYNVIVNMPLRNFDNLLGVGNEGIAIDLGDKVLKIFYGDKIKKDKLDFYKICKTEKYNVFPKVYRIGKGYVILEKLKMHTEKCRAYQYFIDKWYNDFADDTIYDTDITTDADREVIGWMRAVDNAIKENKLYADLGDLREDNFGERDNGEIVYFDL